MHKSIYLIVIFSVISNFAVAQKFGHYDSGYVLGQMPDYAEKQKELEGLWKEYDKLVWSLQNEAEKMRADLRSKEILFTPEMIQDRQKEIAVKEQEALDKKTELFGYNGLIYKKQEELLRPLRQKVFEAIEVVCTQNGLDYLFDKASDIGIAYSNPEHDYTEFVLEELGIKKKQN